MKPEKYVETWFKFSGCMLFEGFPGTDPCQDMSEEHVLLIRTCHAMLMFMLMLRRPGATRRHWCHKKALVPQEGTGATRRHLCHKTMPCHAHVHAHVKKVLVPQEGTCATQEHAMPCLCSCS